MPSAKRYAYGKLESRRIKLKYWNTEVELKKKIITTNSTNNYTWIKKTCYFVVFCVQNWCWINLNTENVRKSPFRQLRNS